MKEIVFSDSTKGSMKVAQRWNPENMLRDGPTAVFGKRLSEEELCRIWAGEPLGGSSQDVLGLSFYLDVGDISGEATGLRRAEEIRRMQSWMDNAEFATFFRRCAEDLQKTKAAAEKGEKIRIWTSDAPAAACGLRHLLWEIRSCEGMVSVVELPKHWSNGNGTVTRYTDWGEVHPGHFARFLPLERALDRDERRVLTDEWSQAINENMPLRAMVNGRLLGVPEDFYDYLLRRHIPDAPFLMARLIGDAIGRYQLGISDGWYALRIRAMIDRGELKVVSPGDGQHPYGMILSKVG